MKYIIHLYIHLAGMSPQKDISTNDHVLSCIPNKAGYLGHQIEASVSLFQAGEPLYSFERVHEHFPGDSLCIDISWAGMIRAV